MSLSTATDAEMAKFVITRVELHHGPSGVIIIHRRYQLTPDSLEELGPICGFHHRHAAPYYPQTNGGAVRTNRTHVIMLSTYLSSQDETWDDLMPFIAYAYNTDKRETTGYASFYLVIARPRSAALDTLLPHVPHHNGQIPGEEDRPTSWLRTLSSQATARCRFDS